MKKLSLLFYAFLFFCAAAHAQSTGINDKSFEVKLSGNGYVYPESNLRTWRLNTVTKKGLINWNDQKIFTRTFFYPQLDGDIEVSLKLRLRQGESAIKVQLDSAGKSYVTSVNKSPDYEIVPVGRFTVNDLRYHFLEISGIKKSGNFFPDIESIIISGPGSEDLKFNLSDYRGAASTHLRYQYPKDSVVAWFYSEVTVPVGVNAVNAYYETNGFNDGYSGIQLNSTTERRFIFSIWSNYKTDNPKEIPADYAVTLLGKGKDVFTGEFGNEGSGGHSHLVFPWKQGVTYKILVGAKPKDDHTIYSCYYFAPEIGKWNLLSTWDKTKTGGKLLSGLYAFVENFGSNGNDFFKALYGNQWICTPSGTWIELTKCSFTTTASPKVHQRYDYGAGVENNQFYMFSGGFKELNNIEPHAVISRKPNGIAPDIDFNELPVK